MPLSAVRDAIAQHVEAWGLRQSAIEALLHPERLFSDAVANPDTMDASGEVYLTRGEVLAALDPRLPLKRVCRSVQHHLPELKAAFARAAAALPSAPSIPADDEDTGSEGGASRVFVALAPGPAGQIAVDMAVGSPPDPYATMPASTPLDTKRVPLTQIHDLLRQAVRDSAQGYGILSADAEAELSQARFEEYARFAGLDASVAAGGATWAEFVGTVLHCLNR